MIRPGDHLGRWIVVGRYEDSTAYVCRDSGTGSRGLLYSADPSTGFSLDSVRRRAVVWGRLKHPVALEVLDVNPQQGFLVTEMPSGDNLQQKLEGSVVGLDLALRMAREVADCLDYAHARGIHHWQIAPARVVFIRDQVKLLGFSEDQQAPPVTENPPAWQFPYLPHEVLKRGGGGDPVQWDLFALAVTLYESLTGDRAYVNQDQDGPIPGWMIRDKLRTPSLDPGPAFPRPVRQLVQRATAAKPRNRFPSAAALRDEIEATRDKLAKGEGGASPRLRAALRIVLAILLLIGVGGLGVMFAGMDPQNAWGPSTRPVRVVVDSEVPDALHFVTVNGQEAVRAAGTTFYFPSVAVGPADVEVISGKGCGPPYCPGEKCPFCCTGARVTRTVEAGGGDLTLVIPVEDRGSHTPRPVVLTAPELPRGTRSLAYLYGEDVDLRGRAEGAHSWRFQEVAPGPYEMLVEAGRCSRAALGCWPDGQCPKGCTSLLDVLLVPCGEGDLEIAVDLPPPE